MEVNTIEYVLSYLVSYGILATFIGVATHFLIADESYANAKALVIGLLWPISLVVLLVGMFWNWVTTK